MRSIQYHSSIENRELAVQMGGSMPNPIWERHYLNRAKLVAFIESSEHVNKANVVYNGDQLIIPIDTTGSYLLVEDDNDEGRDFLMSEDWPHAWTDVLHPDNKTMMRLHQLIDIKSLAPDREIVVPGEEREFRWYLSKYFRAGMGVDDRRLCMDGKKQFEGTDTDMYPGLRINEMMKAFMEARENILFLYGPYGTGKTHLIRYLCASYADDWMRSPKGIERGGHLNVAYTDDRPLVETDGFWEIISGFPVVIFDDLDTELRVPRTGVSSPMSNRLRRQSNGVIESDQKIIITTNCKVDEVDPALLRSGRCFDFIELAPMELVYAQALWNERELNPVIGEALFRNKEVVTQAEFISAAKTKPESIERPYTDPPRAYTIESKLGELRGTGQQAVT